MVYSPTQNRLTGSPINNASLMLEGLVALGFTSSTLLSGPRPTKFLHVELVRSAGTG
ncbi:hypothetical protein TSAR_010210 [Trichomalopsis sarcophagae]|uniref:Uncharacterized protein n=1 Tax=Trichomalopsis sarcophagae TaxID=543379 RepID=A0A232FMN3_9HYME|nr:hypothetical protein TSAR_010210 [Trichomalopsis sarcophagae]